MIHSEFRNILPNVVEFKDNVKHVCVLIKIYTGSQYVCEYTTIVTSVKKFKNEINMILLT